MQSGGWKGKGCAATERGQAYGRSTLAAVHMSWMAEPPSLNAIGLATIAELFIII